MVELGLVVGDGFADRYVLGDEIGDIIFCWSAPSD